METLAALRERLPEAAKDIKLNLQSVLSSGVLTLSQRWGVAAAAALASRHPLLSRAVLSDARREAGDAVVDDAIAAAALMGMNNVFYRFKHRIGKPAYQDKPARLRMNRLAKPATNKLDFELFSLAVSAINDCESCVRAHEQAVTDGGITDDAVVDATRIAATIHAAAVALEAAEALEGIERPLAAAAPRGAALCAAAGPSRASRGSGARGVSPASGLGSAHSTDRPDVAAGRQCELGDAAIDAIERRARIAGGPRRALRHEHEELAVEPVVERAEHGRCRDAGDGLAVAPVDTDESSLHQHASVARTRARIALKRRRTDGGGAPSRRPGDGPQ